MKRIAQMFALLSIAGLHAGAPRALAATPTWVKKAVGFPEQCWSYGDFKFQDCKSVRILSPDGRSSVEVFYRPVVVTKDDHILQAFLRVTTPTQGTHEAALPEGFQKVDLQWSPDSKAFFVNGGNGGGYWRFWVYVYQADHLTNPIDIAAKAAATGSGARLVSRSSTWGAIVDASSLFTRSESPATSRLKPAISPWRPEILYQVSSIVVLQLCSEPGQ